MSETAELGRQWESMRAKKPGVITQIPTLCALFSIFMAVIMFGADTSMFSLIASFIVLFLTAVCAMVFSDMRVNFLIIAMFVCWAAFTGMSYYAGYTAGHEEHYLMSLSAIAIFWLGQYAGTTYRGAEFAWRFFLYVGLMYSICAFFQHIYTPDKIFGIDKPYHQNRLTGSFLSSNTAATFLGIVVLASTAQIYRTWRISFAKNYDSETKVFLDMLQNSVLSSTTFLFAFVALLLTASRAGIAVTFFVGFLFFLWVLSQVLFQRNTFGYIRLGPALLLIVGFVAMFYFFWQMSGGQVSERYDNVFEDVTDRARMLKASWIAYQYQPVFGHGLGAFNEAKLLAVDPINYSSIMDQKAAHNFVAQNLVQVGVVGVGVLSMLYLAVVLPILKCVIVGTRYKTYIAAILLISMLICFHGLFDYALEIPAVMLTHMWLLGLGYGIQLKFVKR